MGTAQAVKKCERLFVRFGNRLKTNLRSESSKTSKDMMNRPEKTFATGQIRLERRLPSYWRVTFDIPPVNIFGPKEIPILNEIVTAIEKIGRAHV